MSGKFGAFVAGSIIGAAAVFLCSPENGQRNRALVADKINEVWGSAQQAGSHLQQDSKRVYDDVSSQAHVAAGNATSAAQDAFTKVQDRIQNASGNLKPTFTDKNDELREKIDAARKRIAEQVQKNAEQAHDSSEQQIHVSSDDDATDASNTNHDDGQFQL